MTEVKRDASGKFTKKKKKPENPDCEPATKGFVKCIVRKAAEHKHAINIDNCIVMFLAVLLSFVWVWAAVYHDSILALTTGIGALMMFTVGFSFEGSHTGTSNIDGRICTEYIYPDYLKKYTPPVCEKKKECGED